LETAKRTGGGFFSKILLLAFVAAMMLMAWLWRSGSPQGEKTENRIEFEEDDKYLLSVNADHPITETSIELEEDDKYLLLVNADHPITDDEPDYEIVPAYGMIPLLTGDIKLEEATLAAVQQLLQKARENGLDNLLVNDGYRTRETQERIYREAEDKSLVQLPGCSEHQTGLAVDSAARGVNGADMGDSKEGKWLADNAWRYGFILRYPKDKEDITGISYEPWHFRYVGVSCAKEIHENKLCLEEYMVSVSKAG
jgi:D-alanyl-D-alanine carboxypeptidase